MWQQDVCKLASMAKLQGRASLARSYRQLPAVLGGMGFTADNPISQTYRDSRLISIGGSKRDHAEHHLQARRHAAERNEHPAALRAFPLSCIAARCGEDARPWRGGGAGPLAFAAPIS